MPRQRRGAPARSTPSRPTIASSRPGPPQQPPRRTASTLAQTPNPGQANSPSSQSGKAPGLFGQMASTAAGVAVGSSIGHAIGGLFGGNSGHVPVENQAADTSVSADGGDALNRSNQWGQAGCDAAAKQFTTCMDDNGGSMEICQWYLDQWKTCQTMAKTY